MRPLLALIAAVLAANGVPRTTGVRFISPARQGWVETTGDSGLKGRDGMGGGVASGPALALSRTFSPQLPTLQNKPSPYELG